MTQTASHETVQFCPDQADTDHVRVAKITAHLSHLLTGMALTGMLFVPVQARADLPVAIPAGDKNYRWDGAKAPTIDGKQMQIDQTAPTAVLNWRSFNIGEGNSVDFNQPSSSAVALNRIFQHDPSRILGNLTANGQVFLINQNGFLFGEKANVDVNTLVASTLDIDDQIFEDVGLVGAINAPGNPAAFNAAGDMGEISIEQGARLHTQDGGRIMILAPKINNRGNIHTPGGQAILAASQDKVYLASSSDPDLRGLLVEVGTGGDVNNLGEIVAERGNISLLGLAVNQQGLVRATTSATLNGSIRLAAQDKAGATGGSDSQRIPIATRTGALTVGGRVEVLLDENSANEQAPDSQLQPASKITLTGKQVALEADARITAPSGRVDVSAVSNPVSQGGQKRTPDSGVTLNIADGADIDVSGTSDTVLSVASNIIEVQARGSELADSPRQRDGALRGKTLRVDVRKGSPLLDISGALGSVKRTTRERLSTGGTVRLVSDGDLVAGSDSTINIRGGRVNYVGDQVSTTRLVTDDFKVVDISEADPNRNYIGVFGVNEEIHKKWGVTQSFGRSAFSHYESGYVEGRDAGALTVDAPRLAFNSRIQAGSVAGLHQRQLTQTLTDGQRRPFDQRPFGGRVDVLLRTNETDILPSIIVAPDARLNPTPEAGASIDALSPVTLSAAMLNRSGLGKIHLEAPGEIRVDDGGALNLAPGTGLKFDAGRIVFNDDVRTPGGQIQATAGEGLALPQDQVAVDVRDGVVLDVSGLWTNDNPLFVNEDELAPVVLKGGSIDLSSNGALRLAAGSQLRADAGAWREAGGATHGGDGGDIALSATSQNGLFDAELRLDGGLSARGFGRNGNFKLKTNGLSFDSKQIAPGIRMAFDSFGSYRFEATRDGISVAPGAQLRFRQRNLQLTPQAFTRRSGELLPAQIALLPDWQRPATDLALESSSVLSSDVGIDIGTNAGIVADPGAAITLRSATSLKVDGRIVANGGDISLSIESAGGDKYRPERKIWLGDHALLDVSGRYIARPSDLGLRIGQVLDAGAVHLKAKRGSIVTRPGSLIDVHGVAATLDLPAPPRSPFGAQRFEPVQVAGRAGRVDMQVAESGLLQGRYDARVASPTAEGGRFSLLLDPSQRGQPTLADDKSNAVSERFPHTQRILHLIGYQGDLPGADEALADSVNGHAYVPAERLLDSGFTSLALASRPEQLSNVLQTRDSLASIAFDRDMNLKAGRALVLDAPLYTNLGVKVQLTAPYVALGSRFDTLIDGAIPQSEIDNKKNRAITLKPTAGDGVLAVTAKQVDILGHSVWQGFGADGRTGLDIASSGDIRLRGELMRDSFTHQRISGLTGALRTAGDVYLSARQIYPTTLSRFDIRVEDTDAGRIRLDRVAGKAGQALSAGGLLRLEAPVIEQAGVLRAPFGELELKASKQLALLPGSLTSVSGAGLLAPFGQLQFQTDLTFPLGDEMRLPDAPPARSVRLLAPSMDLADGAQIDVSGGGIARAWEFVPGPGGSRDILATTDGTTSFAILPALGNALAPWDPLASPVAEQVQGLRVGDTLSLEGGTGLAAGEYAILPARYALYGGYLVTPVAGTRDLVAGRQTRRADGAPILAGRRRVAGTDMIESRSQGYAIEDGRQVRQRAEYVEKDLDTLFPNAITRMADAGRFSVEAGRSLKLGAELLRNRAGGRGAQVDISAESLRVVQQQQNNGIELTADALSRLGAESLLLGGLRTDTADAFQVKTTAQKLVVEDGVELALPELILVAHDLQIGEGGQTTLRRIGPTLAAAKDLDIVGDAAVVAVSSRKGLQARRSQTPGNPSASLTVGKGAELLAQGGGLILDSTTDLNLNGDFSAVNGSLQFGSRGVSLGETDGLGLDSLVLSNATLAGLQGTDLILRSGSQVNVYGVLEDNAGNPMHFGRITLDAPGLVGHALVGRTLALNGDQVELSNFSQRTVTSRIAADGNFLLQANQLTLDGQQGGAAFALAGFADQRLVARDGLRIQGGGHLSVDGDLTLQTPRISAASGAQGGLDAAGRLVMEGTGIAEQVLADAGGLAARLDVNAEAITADTAIVLPSGILSMTASGADGITLKADGKLDVSGRDENFDGTVLTTPGGEVRLTAQGGGIRLEGGRIDVSSAPAGGRGGRLQIEAKNGDVRIGAVQLAGQGGAGEDGAGLSVDAQGIRTLAATQSDRLTPLLATLAEGDFSGEQSIRIRQGDVSLQQDERLVAQHVALSADQGSLTVAGEIDAEGGRIELAAADTLAVSGALKANAVDGTPGRIELIALDADADGQSGLAVSNGAQLELGGGGLLQLFVPAGANGTLTGLQPFLGTVKGAATREVLGVRILQNPGLSTTTGISTLTQADIDRESTAMDAFVQAAQGQQPAGFRLRPLLDVRADKDLVVAGGIDLNNTRFGADKLPGTLMLRAADKLVFDAGLSDGVEQTINTTFGFGLPETRLGSDESWSYRLVGGADTSAASLQAVNPGGKVVLNDGSRVRTGTGDITVASGSDLNVGKGAAIYTFGRDAGAGAFADVVFPQFNNLDGSTLLLAMTNGIQFGEDGGALRVQVQGDLTGKGVTALNQGWQPKVGGDYESLLSGRVGKLPVIRGVNVEKFADGLGVLGGGIMQVSAGRDISGLSLVMPGTIKPVENLGVLRSGASVTLEQRADTRFATSGGSSLQVRAGRDLSNFYLQADQGKVRVSAGHDIRAAQPGQANLLGVGDADIALLAGNRLQVDKVFDPGLIAQADTQFALFTNDASLKDLDTLFLSQSANARLSMTSLAGDAVYGRVSETPVLDRLSLQSINQHINSKKTETLLGLNIVPAKFELQSVEGNAGIASTTLNALPASEGYLRVLAGNDIVLSSSLRLVQADADPSLLADFRFPLDLNSNQLVNALSSSDPGFHALIPIHGTSTQFNHFVARNGDIRRSGDVAAQSSLIFSNQTRLVAGRDILDLNVNIQHANARQISLVSAGRDIRQATLRVRTTGALRTDDTRSYTIGGPGQLQFRAGRSIDLGATSGIVSNGNTANAVLPDDGASINILAGYSGEPDYEAFMARYIDSDRRYLPRLHDFLTSLHIDAATDTEARTALHAIDPLQRKRFLSKVLFSELKASGLEATRPPKPDNDYSRGFDAIATLFPHPNPDGRLDIKLSKINTLNGGDIDLLMPGGLINGGAASNAALSKPANELGVVTARAGDISAFVDGDFLVNQSRVFALNGDLLMWSSNGDLNAGRGSKTALASPPPKTRIDPKTGQTIVEFPASISGSGLLGVNAFLFAPRGKIDAGDAGISALGNLFVGAAEVIGNGNITFGGLSVGVPTANSGGIAAGLTGVSNLASSATSQAVDNAASMASVEDGSGQTQQLGLLSVEILGFGE